MRYLLVQGANAIVTDWPSLLLEPLEEENESEVISQANHEKYLEI
ncbi:hypothetical protein ACFFHM_17625 [Halalkalibacter kiskunsagensis]|uniref:GP-PDE domain-containing protein n=1 Tax=Halalkalibacter kiskunsagensis TaxID=1548599 RepID=A0ABV6KH23_9BACI